MKKFLLFVLTFLSLLLITDNVYAATLSKPYSIDRHYSSSSTCTQNGNNENCYSTDTNILTTTINGNSSYSAGNYFYRYLGSMTDIPLYNQVNFVNLGGLCKNSNFTLSGKMYSNNSFFNKIRPTVFMQNNSGYFTCSYAYDSNDILSFTCSNRTDSVGITSLALQFQWFYIYEQTTQLYLDTNLQYSCDVNTSDIINNQNNNANSIINNQNQNQAQTNEKLDKVNGALTDEIENSDGTCKGVICNLKKVVIGIIDLPKNIANLILNALKSLFIPDDMDFVTNFLNSIESKLGFIAEIPISIINFMLSLANATWEDVTSISFPSVSIFGYNFWNAQEIDISEGINIFKPFKYITDCLCVIFLSRGLFKCWENFNGGSEK